MYSVHKILVLLVLGTSAVASPVEYVPAIRVEQSLIKRAFAGGWPLAAATCPSDTIRCNENFASQTNPNCCPSNYVCKGSLIAPYCCPTNADCMTEVENFPICAGADEVMYHITQPSDKKFCCKKGQIGVIPLSGYTGICRDASSPPAASLLATVVAQYGATAVGPNPTATNSPAAAGTSATSSSGSTNGNSNGANGANSGSQTGPAGAGPTTIINNSQSSSSSSASASANASSGSSLSTGAIAGIAVGAAGLIGIILALGWFYRSGKFSKKGEPSAPAPVYTETKDSAPYQQNATAYTRSDSGGVNEWKSPASQYSEIGGSTVYGGGSGVVSPISGRNELSP